MEEVGNKWSLRPLPIKILPRFHETHLPSVSTSLSPDGSPGQKVTGGSSDTHIQSKFIFFFSFFFFNLKPFPKVSLQVGILREIQLCDFLRCLLCHQAGYVTRCSVGLPQDNHSWSINKHRSFLLPKGYSPIPYNYGANSLWSPISIHPTRCSLSLNQHPSYSDSSSCTLAQFLTCKYICLS